MGSPLGETESGKGRQASALWGGGRACGQRTWLLGAVHGDKWPLWGEGGLGWGQGGLGTNGGLGAGPGRRRGPVAVDLRR